MSESQFQTILSAIQELNGKVDSFENRFDRIEGRLDKVEERMDKVERLLVDISGELKRIEYWTPYHASEDIVARLEAIKTR